MQQHPLDWLKRGALTLGAVAALNFSGSAVVFAKQDAPRPIHDGGPATSTPVDNSFSLDNLTGDLMLKNADQINLLNAFATMDMAFWPSTLKKNHNLINDEFIRVLANRGANGFKRALDAKVAHNEKDANGYAEISFRYMFLADLCAGEIHKDRIYQYKLAQKYIQYRSYTMAFAILSNILMMEPDNLPARILSAELREGSGDFYGAMVDFQRVVKKDPNNGLAWTAIGKAYLISSDFAKAKDALHHAVACNGDNKEAVQLLYQVEHPQQLPPPGPNQMEPAPPPVTEQSVAEQIARQGDTYLQQNRVKEATDEYGRALKMNETNVRAHMGLGSIAFRNSDFQRAIVEYEKAAKFGHGQESAEGLRFLGLACEQVYDRSKDTVYLDRAIECLARAINIKSDYAQARADQERVLAKKADLPVH